MINTKKENMEFKVYNLKLKRKCILDLKSFDGIGMSLKSPGRILKHPGRVHKSSW